MAINNEGYEFKKLSEAEVVTELQEGDNVVIISDSDTKQIGYQEFTDVVENDFEPRMQGMEAEVDAAIGRLEDDVLVAVKDSDEVAELPETATVVVVDETEDPETGDVTKTVERVPADQFGKGGSTPKWYTVTSLTSLGSAIGSKLPLGSGTLNIDDIILYSSEAGIITDDEADGSKTEFNVYGKWFGEETRLYVNDTLQVLGTDYTYELKELSIADFEESGFQPLVYNGIVTFTVAPPAGAEIKASGKLAEYRPLVNIYDTSAYQVPGEHVDPVDPATFIDTVRSNEYDIHFTFKWDKLLFEYYWAMFHGAVGTEIPSEFIEVVEGQTTYDITNTLVDPIYVYTDKGDLLVEGEDYVFTDENTKITFMTDLTDISEFLILCMMAYLSLDGNGDLPFKEATAVFNIDDSLMMSRLPEAVVEYYGSYYQDVFFTRLPEDVLESGQFGGILNIIGESSYFYWSMLVAGLNPRTFEDTTEE